MRKKLVGGLIALVLAIGGGVAITMTSSDAHACTKCNTSNKARKCGRCKSERLFAEKEWWENGKLRTLWKCQDCPHNFITELSNGKEVVISTSN